jgi:hypothetical protein
MDANQSKPNKSPGKTAAPNKLLMGIVLACYIVSIALILTICLYIWRNLDISTLAGQTFAVRLMQTTLGMLIGVTFAITGVYAVSIGLLEETNAEVTGWGKAAAAGPGGLLVLCGTIVIALCLTREFVIRERGGQGTDLIPANENSQPK